VSSKEKQRINDRYAYQQRGEFRKHQKGLPNCHKPGNLKFWRRDPKDWAWFNEPEIEIEFLTLPKLRKAVKEKGISGQERYKKKSPKHSDWPSNPGIYYRDEWVSWRDLFGKKKFLTLPKLGKVVKKRGIKSNQSYHKASTKHSDWPSNPQQHYRDEWVSWHDLFGTEKKKFLTLSKLRKAVKKKAEVNSVQYSKEAKKHSDWPAGPNVFYGDEWVSWHDLFGRKKKKFLTLPKLRKAVKKRGISSHQYWKESTNHPDWPSNPLNHYGDEWVSWRDLFGTSRIGKALEKASTLFDWMDDHGGRIPAKGSKDPKEKILKRWLSINKRGNKRGWPIYGSELKALAKKRGYPKVFDRVRRSHDSPN
jgi:glutaredoxin-related protein